MADSVSVSFEEMEEASETSCDLTEVMSSGYEEKVLFWSNGSERSWSGGEGSKRRSRMAVISAGGRDGSVEISGRDCVVILGVELG